MAWQEKRADTLNLPHIGCDSNRGYWTSSQVNISHIPQPDSAVGTQQTQGRASRAHPDGKDDPFASSTSVCLQITTPDLDDGYIVLVEYGIIIPTRCLSVNSFSGLGLHFVIPPSFPHGAPTRPIEKHQTRMLVILYPHAAPVNGRVAKLVGYTTSGCMVEIDRRTFIDPTCLRQNPNNANFVRDSGAIMQPRSAINYQLWTALESAMSILSGVEGWELDIPLNELIKLSKYRLKGSNDDWTRFEEWPDAPKLDAASKWVLEQKRFFEEADVVAQESSLHCSRLAYDLSESDLKKADFEPRPDAGRPPKRKFNECTSCIAYLTTSTDNRTATLSGRTRVSGPFILYDASSAIQPKRPLNLKDVNFSTLFDSSTTIRSAVTALCTLPSNSTQAFLTARVHMSPLFAEHASESARMDIERVLSNARVMLGNYGVWLHLRSIEGLLIDQHHILDTFSDPLGSDELWPSHIPVPLRVLKILHDYSSCPPRRKPMRTTISPLDVLDEDSIDDDDDDWDARAVSLKAAVASDVELSSLSVVEKWSFLIERVVWIFAIWMGQRGKGEKRLKNPDLRGKLVHAILLAGYHGLLVHDEVFQAFMNPDQKLGIADFNPRTLQAELESFWTRDETVHNFNVVLDNCNTLSNLEPVLDDLIANATDIDCTPLVERLESVETRSCTSTGAGSPTDPIAHASSMSRAAMAIALFLTNAEPAIMTDAEPTIVSTWIAIPDARCKDTPSANVKSPFRALGPDRAFAIEQLRISSHLGSEARVFSALLLGVITFNSCFMAGVHRQVIFCDLDDFRNISNQHDENFMVNKCPFASQQIEQRSSGSASKVWDAARAWVAMAGKRVQGEDEDEGTKVPFDVAYNWLFKHGDLPGCGKFTCFVIACDMVHFDLVHSPDARMLWKVMATSYDKMGSKAALFTLGVMEEARGSALASEENTQAFVDLYDATRRLLGDKSARLLPDAIHFEHALCKFKRFTNESKHNALVEKWKDLARPIEA